MECTTYWRRNMSEILSICIPTRNRSSYLEDLLESIVSQIESDHIQKKDIKIYISDNASTDNTRKIVQTFQKRYPHIHYQCNSENIGGNENIALCSRIAQGNYCWIVGDDEIINPRALVYILSVLCDNRIGLFLNNDGVYNTKLHLPATFKSYRDFALECIKKNPHILLAHSLITSNIFKTNIFDYEIAENTIKINYAHMYGIVKGLSEKGGSIFITDKSTVTVRKQRAAAVDGIWPSDITQNWLDYLYWLKDFLELPELKPHQVVTNPQIKFIIIKNMFKSTLKIILPSPVIEMIKSLRKQIFRDSTTINPNIKKDQI